MREWLREIRLKQEFTQEQVATKANISQQHYSDIENGKKGIPVKTAKSISRVLGFNWQRFYE